MPDNHTMYDSLSNYVDLTLIELNKQEQKNLRKSLSKINFNDFDRVVSDLLFSKIFRQARFFRKISGLLCLDEDICQNYIPTSKWYRKYSKFYSKIKHVTVLCSSWEISQRLMNEGVHVEFFPKAYDDKLLMDNNQYRDIEVGFIGRTKSKVYSERLTILKQLQHREGLKILRTDPGGEYLVMLNRIRFFVSADVGLHEYMCKNFEAMACGCILIAFRQGQEESKLGLKDMENIVLYSCVDEAIEKLNYLKNNPVEADQIKKEGVCFAKERHSYTRLGEKLLELLNKKSLQIEQPRGLFRWF